MELYVRKIFEHDLTHEISVTKDIVETLFNEKNFKIKGKNSFFSGDISINDATDLRFGGDFKKVITKEGEMNVDDLIIIYKNKDEYTLEIIGKKDCRYKTYYSLFKNKERHAIICVDDNIYHNTDNIAKENISTYSKKIKIDKPFQRIFFGAPGTGKSFNLNKEAKEYFGSNFERVTFHPNYMYGNFVGAFKPFPQYLKDEDGNKKGSITYKYIEGPLMRILVKALKHPNKNYLLIIEEINRANTAAVFGDFFQLLDRQADGESEYPITTSEEVRMYLDMEFSDVDDEDIRTYIDNKIGSDYERLVLPSNLYIWSTMNSADQGVMPMDTAFKRRWEFTYIGIDDILEDSTIANEFEGYEIKISKESTVKWNDFRTEVNNRLSSQGVPEDKLLGPYFISKSVLESEDIDKITETIKNKVLMYLYDDAGKPYRNHLFISEKSETYSALCRNFDENGKAIFKKTLEIEDKNITIEDISDEDSEI